MKRLIAILAACTVSFGAGAASPYYSSAKGEFSTFLRGLEYDPSRACSKPMRPFVKDKWAWENYARDGATYLDCIRDASSSDMEYAENVIQTGYRDAADEFLEEVRRGY
ncbi:hypothetical protein OVY29_04900 [Sphingopyxis sp. SE2]|uniref:hypothetical protein n=1 Tax=Sphingopyxis sp. SE2 TaxID=1586240 RepID=UPI0028C1156D|nr:hypothetical protein [Sphingopyxis sp. SE2]MDT7527996.1 hypothetical protein [Sphingopyxis sp. SE2]